MRKRFSVRVLSMLFVCLLFAGCAPAQLDPEPCIDDGTSPLPKGSDSIALAVPEYPPFLSFEDYEGERERREEIPEELLESINVFSAKTSSKLLRAEVENALYSPASLYFALSMLSESAGGETREQILSLLNTDIDSLRSGIGTIYRAVYTDNEYCKRQAANSLWLPMAEEFVVKDAFFDTLSTDYYAEIYRTEFGTEQSAEDIADWIADHTGGKLGGDPANFQTLPFPDTAMILYNTLYYKDEWIGRFDENKTKEDTFLTAEGKEVTCDFMNRTYGSHGINYGENYSSVNIALKEGTMQFILPDEGVTPYDILMDNERMTRIFTDTDPVENMYSEVVFSVPKFDYSDKLDLMDALSELGVTDAFSREKADFSPASDWTPLFVSRVRQETNIAIDENGVEAAAFTEIAYAGAGMPEGRGEMILDRPFLYIIYSRYQLPMFIGVVNDPTA